MDKGKDIAPRPDSDRMALTDQQIEVLGQLTANMINDLPPGFVGEEQPEVMSGIVSDLKTVADKFTEVRKPRMPEGVEE